MRTPFGGVGPRVAAAAFLTLTSPAIAPGDEPEFSEPAKYSVGRIPEAIAIGDLNGDRILDAVTANTHAGTSAQNGDVTVLLGRRGGLFFHAGEFPTGDRPEGIALGHMNGDAHLDAITADFEGDSLSILLGDGSGSFEEPITLTARGGPRSLVAMDLDGDGDVDIATADYNADRVSVWMGSGDAQLKKTGTVVVGDGPEVITAGHVDADVHLDLLTVDARSNAVTALIADGRGGFTPRPPRHVGERPRFGLLRDLDGDGFDDLIVANHFSETVMIDRNISGERFERAAVLESGGLDRPIHIEVADVTGDRSLDVLVTWFESDAFTISAGTGEGFDFAPPTIHATGHRPVGLAVGDFDRDGDRDVLVTNAMEDTAFVYESILVKAESGTFRRADPNADGSVNLSDAVFVLAYLFAARARPPCMESADVDDSGALDLADAIHLLNYLVRGGAPPPPPFPSCGDDGIPGDLGCDSHPPCGNGD